MRIWIVTIIVFSITAIGMGTGAVAGQSIGRTIGEAGRAIVDDSQSAYQDSRDFFVETGHSISQGARDAYDEASDYDERYFQVRLRRWYTTLYTQAVESSQEPD